MGVRRQLEVLFSDNKNSLVDVKLKLLVWYPPSQVKVELISIWLRPVESS